MIIGKGVSGTPRFLVLGVGWPLEPFLLDLFSGLSKAGVSVTVGSVDPRFRAIESAGIEWRWIPGDQSGRARRLYGLLSSGLLGAGRSRAQRRRLATLLHRLPSSAKKARFWERFVTLSGAEWDFVYFPWNLIAVDYMPWPFADCRPIISCRGSHLLVRPHLSSEGSIRKELRRGFEYAWRVHCVSEHIREKAFGYGLSSTKAWLNYPGVDTELFSPAPDHPRPNEVSFVTVASMKWVKGLEYALEAVRRIKELGISVRYHIVGSGPEEQRVRYCTEDLGLEGDVVLWGELGRTETLSVLRSADVYLASSVSEGISNAVLEAMACKLPVVSTACGGMAEAVSDGEDGFLVDIRDAEAMAKAGAMLARNATLRRQMGEAARRKVKKKFSLRRNISRWTGLLNESDSCGIARAREQGEYQLA